MQINNMKRLSLFFLVLFTGISLTAAQITTPLPGKCEAFRPDALYSPILFSDVATSLMKSDDYGQNSSKRNSKSKEYWIVYSDRTDNTTYTAPGSSTKFSSLDFNEKVRIAKISNGYALVYSEPKEQELYPAISSQSEWRGWIPMSNLLLWNSCPATRKGIYEKAMICANIDKSIENGNLGKLFGNPKNTSSFTQLSINFNYYFVMKKVGSMALLSTQNTMNGKSDQVLYGWVDENSFVAWNQRSCLEPTWEIEDVEYFAKNGIKVNIYQDKALKNRASYIAFSKKNSQNLDPYMYRMDGRDLRYPILDGSTGDLWRCSTFSSIGNGGAINMGGDRVQKAANTINVNLDKLSKINIVIVIDGTKSMEKYFPAVRDAIKEVKAFFQKSDKVKVGVLIYRDKRDGQYVTESFPFTDPQNPKLAEFLEKGGAYGIKSSSSDKSLEEALYYGINKALDTFPYNPDESNMMFVIGDCGNSKDYPEITKEVIERKLIAKKVSLMGFQVRNETTNEAFPMFNNNMCALIKGSMQGQFDELKEGVVVKAQLTKNSYRFTNNATNIQNALYVGSHMYVQKGSLDVKELIKQIEDAVVAVKDNIELKKSILVAAGNGVTANKVEFSGNSVISGPVLEKAWLEKRIGKSLADELTKTNSTVSFKGYTAKTDKSSSRDYYKTVIFISREELNVLMTRLSPLYEVAMNKSNDREPYVKAMKALVRSMLPGISDEEMNKKGMDEVMALVSGLNASTIMTKGRSIAEVASTQAVNAMEYQSIIAKFKRQYMKLQAIQKKPYKFTRTYNEAVYYWIPTEDLP